MPQQKQDVQAWYDGALVLGAISVCTSTCFLISLWSRPVCFSIFHPFSALKYLQTTWFCLLLRKQPSWAAAQLSQSWHEGFRDRPANRLSKACAKIALTQGHSATQSTAHIFALISALVCVSLCMGI